MQGKFLVQYSQCGGGPKVVFVWEARFYFSPVSRKGGLDFTRPMMEGQYGGAGGASAHKEVVRNIFSKLFARYRSQCGVL